VWTFFGLIEHALKREQRGCEKMGTATDFDEILLQFFWIDPRATRIELFEGARQKKGQEFRKSGPVTIFS
jgi:hypothetical protein